MRRLHAEIPLNYRASSLLFDDTNNVEELLSQLQTRKPLDVISDPRWSMTVMLNASRAILCLDVESIDLAAKHAMATLSLIRGKSPIDDFSGSIVPAAAALSMRVFLRMSNTSAVQECHNILVAWSEHIPVARIWADLVPAVFNFAQEHRLSVDSPTSDDDFNWNEMATHSGLLFDEDLGVFLGLSEPVSPRLA